MFIDIVFFVLLIIAFFKGYQRGLIIAVFSFVAIIIGLAAAMKLSSLAADYLAEVISVSPKWMPFISFTLVFILVVILVRWVANLIDKGAKWIMLGWVNRIGGFLLFAALYIIVLSVILFYAQQLHLIADDTISKSVTWPFIQPWGPKVINSLGEIIPFFKDMFTQLQNFFESYSTEGSKPVAVLFSR